MTAVVLSVELVLAIGALLSRVPVAVDPAFVHSIIWHYQRGFQPQRNLFFYFLWLVLVIGIYALAMTFGKGRSRNDLKGFLIFHVLIVGMMCHAGFAIAAMGNPVWAWPVFWTAFACGFLASVFWPEFLAGTSFVKARYAAWGLGPRVGMLLGSLFIVLAIFMPDLQAVVAMVYMGDYFHNWDFTIWGPVYAIAHGLLPCVDVDAPYGFGAVVMLAKLVNSTGGFEYVKLLAIVLWTGIIYFILWFFLLRRFLASGLLAFAAIILALRVQMFSVMTGAIIWVPVMSSFFRYCFDIGVFWMLWMHIQTRRTVFLAAGAFFVSLALYHMPQTGVYALFVFVLYVCASAFLPGLGGRKGCSLWRNHALIMGTVLLWTGLWFYMSVGPFLFRGIFWRNLVGNGSLHIKGALDTPLISSISAGNIVQGIGGLLYPLFCMVSFLYVAGRVIIGKAERRDVFAGLLAFYGLMFHTYYMLMMSGWFIFTLPGIWVLFYWIAKICEKIPAYGRPWAKGGVVAFMLYGLMTTSMFTSYPNLLNFSRNPVVDPRVSMRVGPRQVPYFHQLLADYPEAIKLPLNSLGQKDEQLKYEKDFPDHGALKIYYQQQTAWPEDAGLIRRLTPEGSKVPVLSSFEILLLQKAGRKPFFYHFPLLNSRPLAVRNFMVTCLVSYPQVQDVLDQLEAQKPPYIFMERIFLASQVPQVYFSEYDDLIILLRYVLSKYEPAEFGKYLVAMKLRGPS